jgi:hypothetical protein
MASDSQQGASDSGWKWSGLIDDLPYAAIIVLSLVGISWASISPAPTATYWVVLTPVIALICIVAGWRHTARGERFRMAVTQVLQWAAVLIAMYLTTITDLGRSLNANATGLLLLTLLALGVFVSGLNLRAWKLCVTGAFLAIAVPAIAWIQNAALLLLLIGAALLALMFLYWWIRERTRRRET